MILIVLDRIKFKLFVVLLCHMRSSFSLSLLYHAYVYLEFLILACTIYILELDIYHCSDWRAPRVVYREDLDEYWMFLAARAFYAAKTAGHDMERYICGWNPTKDENIFGFWPDKFKGRDCRTWDWGGSMVVHQLIQQPDGNLGLALP